VLRDLDQPGEAVLIVPGLLGSYAALRTAGSELLLVDGRSLRVSVYVQTTGLMGKFRRSRETGLWFSGWERYHSVGNLRLD
jgi:hypothetical protein